MGWVIALIIVGAVVLLIADPQESSGSDEPSTAGSIIRLILGVALLMLALVQWRGRPKEGQEPKMPKWMSAIDSFTLGKSLGMGVLLAGVNPKNLGMTLGAAMAIAQVDLSGVESAVSMGVFILIASITIAAPVVLNLVMGKKASKKLDGWKTWLTVNNAAVMFVLLLLLGMVLIGQGVRALTGS